MAHYSLGRQQTHETPQEESQALTLRLWGGAGTRLGPVKVMGTLHGSEFYLPGERTAACPAFPAQEESQTPPSLPGSEAGREVHIEPSLLHPANSRFHYKNIPLLFPPHPLFHLSC